VISNRFRRERKKEKNWKKEILEKKKEIIMKIMENWWGLGIWITIPADSDCRVEPRLLDGWRAPEVQCDHIR